MKDAVQEAVAARLTDLTAAAQRLQGLLDARSDAPPFPLARLAVDVDGMVGALERHAQALEPT